MYVLSGSKEGTRLGIHQGSWISVLQDSGAGSGVDCFSFRSLGLDAQNLAEVLKIHLGKSDFSLNFLDYSRPPRIWLQRLYLAVMHP